MLVFIVFFELNAIILTVVHTHILCKYVHLGVDNEKKRRLMHIIKLTKVERMINVFYQVFLNVTWKTILVKQICRKLFQIVYRLICEMNE